MPDVTVEIRNPECDFCQFGASQPKPPRNICLLPEEIEPHDVMLVAEQPTAQDDIYGMVFSGKGLAEIKTRLENMGLDVYATYAIKCVRPNKDIKPKSKDAKTCGFGCAPRKGEAIVGGYLQEEIKQVKPKHIICMGSNTFVAVTGKVGSFAELKSNRYYDERLQAHIYATDHHASAMYNVQVKEQLFADLERFKGWMDDDTNGKKDIGFNPPIRVASTLKSLRMMQKMIRNAGGIVAVDTETQGLNPYDPDKTVRCIQFCWDAEYGGVFVPLELEEECFFTAPHMQHNYWQEDETLDEAIEIIREILLESWCIWHNGKFDRIWLNQWGKRRFGKPILAPNIYMDTMHMAHALDENRVLKLKQLITTELGYPTYDINDKLTKDLDILIPYAARDTVASLLLALKYDGILKRKDMRRLKRLYAKITRPADKLFTKMELRGWPVDGARAQECRSLINGLIEETVDKMFKSLNKYKARMVETGLLTYDEEEEEYGELDAKMFASTKKLGILLFDVLMLTKNPDKKVAYTPSGEPATNEDALIHLKGNTFVDLLLEWRGLAKAQSTYVEPMIRAANGRGRITTSYKLTGTVTGRTASGKEATQSKRQGASKAEGMNLQNLLYTYNIRNCIRAREGWSILECDLSQIELRIAGWMSRDPLFLKAYNEGWDIHTIRAMRVNGLTQEEWEALPKDKQKELRKKAKPINFGFIYGMMAPTFKQYALVDYGIDFSMHECSEIRKQFFIDHAGLPAWYKEQEDECKEFGYVESPSGRRRHLPNITLNPAGSKDARSRYNEAVRMAINTPVQGFASDWKLMSMLETDEKVTELFAGKAYLFGEVHDSILLEVRNDVLEDVAKLVLRIMSHPSILDDLGIEIDMPVLAEAKAGPSLGEAKDYPVDWKEAA
jgi:uracil-DNA glycosylase family 4